MTTLFTEINGRTLPPPSNHWELVLFKLIEVSSITALQFAMEFKTLKFSNRLSELEEDLGITLTSKERVQFKNRFSHSGEYFIYTPLLPKNEMIDLYFGMKEKSKKTK